MQRQSLITPHEADRLVAGLRPFAPDDVGAAAWLRQHAALDRLNMQAHRDAQCRSDEFVKEALVLGDKVSLLVADLLVAEAWRERALPRVRARLAEAAHPALLHQLLSHEGVVANLLEVCLHHRDAAEALSEEAALELCDWCARQLAALAGDGGRPRAGERLCLNDKKPQRPW